MYSFLDTAVLMVKPSADGANFLLCPGQVSGTTCLCIWEICWSLL